MDIVIGIALLLLLGWVIKLFFGGRSRRPLVHWHGPGEFSYDIVGESNYQKGLVKIAGGRTKDGHQKQVVALLELEDDNPHDKKAVRVEVEGFTVGYFSREDARSYRRRIKSSGHEGEDATCNALIAGGWNRGLFNKGSFGVKLDLSPKGKLTPAEQVDKDDS